MSGSVYHPPVAKLLHYGACQNAKVEGWPNYVQELDLTQDHIPELIQMVQDEKLWQFFFIETEDVDDIIAREGWDPNVAFWAPIHAWRALGQLQAAEAVKPLAHVLERSDVDWCWEELPQVFGLMGAEAIPPLDELLARKTTDLKKNNKITLISGVTRIGLNFPEQRDRCVAVLTKHLENYEHQHITFNGALIAGLLDLKALEALPVIEAAYAAGQVDEMFVGSWARVQVEFGLKQESDFTPEELAINYTPEQEQLMANLRAYFERKKPGALEQGMPLQREALLPDRPPSFKDIAAGVSTPKPAKKGGFGQAAKSSGKQKKKKKKK